MKPHYFEQAAPDPDDLTLRMAIVKGYVPPGCLLNGAIVLAETSKGRSACWGCDGPRNRCGGKRKRT